MKILTVLLFSILFNLNPGVQMGSNKKSIILQSEIKNPDPVLLKQAGDVIATRLNIYGITSSDITVVGDDKLKIDIPGGFDLIAVEGLLTSKGEIAFYETMTQSEIASLFRTDKEIYTFLNHTVDAKLSDPRVGCSKEKRRAEDHLGSLAAKNLKFLWGNESAEKGYCLFALKVNSDGQPLLKGSDIDSAKFISSKDTGNRIMISLKPSAIKIFADATRNNLNRSIAITIDGKVYSWPVVKSPIEKGKVEVTGDFSESEIKYFPAIFSSGQLPFNLKMIK